MNRLHPKIKARISILPFDQRTTWWQPLLFTASLLTLTAKSMAATPEITQTLQEAKAISTEGAASQSAIDKTRDETDQLLQEYRQLSMDLQQLSINHQQLAEIHQQQQTELSSLEKQLSQVTSTELDIVPMLFASIDWLEQNIDNDLPFHKDERRERIVKLKTALMASGVTLAERYRRVMEAYQIESEFGYTMESWQEAVQLNGSSRQVNVLRIGRIGLYFEALDGSSGGRWDNGAKQWQTVSGDELKHINLGILIAKKQRPQGLLILPVATR